MSPIKRKYPIGAEVFNEGVHFRVFASSCRKVEICLELDNSKNQFFELQPEGNGYFSAFLKEFFPGSKYRFRLNDSENLYPDPASRFQPEGPFGPSQVLDPEEFHWTDAGWKGLALPGQIIYEMHIGTFTPGGTYSEAIKELAELADLGISVIEIMPLNEFPGAFGWGYDGVNLFAPSHLYGSPRDLKAFINEAHKLKIAVILDVVYNHFGPDGNFIPQFSDVYLQKEENDWGTGINFDHLESRLFFLTNIKYWIQEYHFDGFRVDATQAISSTVSPSILTSIAQVAKEAAPERNIIVIGENEPNDSRIVLPVEKGGHGFDGIWNDDFHHSAIVGLTGRRAAYYTDYLGTPQEFISCLKYGFLYQGQYYVWQSQPRGYPTLVTPPSCFIAFLQNHDQIANSGLSQPINQLTDMGSLKAMTCLMLVCPWTPMLFQGQEFCSSHPFHYFADHAIHLRDLVHYGRKEFLSQFPNLASEEILANIPHPADAETFIKSKLDFSERTKNSQMYQFHKDLIKLKKTDPVFSNQCIKFDGAVLKDQAFLIRFFDEQYGDRLILINFGTDYPMNPAPEPLLAPYPKTRWEILWTSESLTYGGSGTPNLNEGTWTLQGRSAIILSCIPIEKEEGLCLQQKK